MALNLLQRSYGVANAGNWVIIKDNEAGGPARAYATAVGKGPLANGRYRLPASGMFAVYLDQGRKYDLLLVSQFTNGMISAETDVSVSSNAPVISQTQASGIRYTLFQSYAPITRTSQNTAADTNLVMLRSVLIPAGTLKENSTLHALYTLSHTNSASSKIIVCKFGGTDVAAPAVTTTAVSRFLTMMSNANSLTAQKGVNSTGLNVSTGNPIISTSVDTRVDITFEIFCKWGAAIAGESVTLEGLLLEVSP